MDYEETLRRMFNRQLYFCDDEVIAAEQLTYLDKLFEYNSLKPSESVKKKKLLKEMFAEIGDDCYIETPFYSNWGGKNVHFGNYIYANFNLFLVDDCDIYVGNHVMFGPNVVLCSGTHPVDPELRERVAQYNMPVHIEDNVWIGSSSIIMPGITIGKNSVIGAGSVVTKDIPANVVAVGNPCRVMREINDNDKQYYYKNCKIDV